MNHKKIRLITFALCALFLAGAAGAQSIEVLSYVPLKRGGGSVGGGSYSYKYISVHSRAEFATEEAAVFTIGNLLANSTTLGLQASNITFGAPVRVRGALFARPEVALNITGALIVGGYFYGGYDVAAPFSGVSAMSAQSVSMPGKQLQIINGGGVAVGNVPLAAPPTGCQVQWRSVSAKDASDTPVQGTYKVLGCF